MSHDMDFIRKSYGVPAKTGVRVTYTGEDCITHGVIIGARGGHLRIRMDGDARAGLYHPTWCLTYHDPEPKPQEVGRG